MKLKTTTLSAFGLIFLFGLTACDNQAGKEKEVSTAVQNAEKEMYESYDLKGDANDQNGYKLEDAMITTKIKAAFLTENLINSLDIDVSTSDGIVTLAGVADSLASSQKAGEIAGLVSDVKQIKNELVIH